MVLRGILQRLMIPKLDVPIKWAELKQAIRKSANGKSPGLNDVPPDAFKALDDTNLLTLLDFSTHIGTRKLISTNGTKAKSYQSPRAETLVTQTI